jgi:hypothetical protein
VAMAAVTPARLTAAQARATNLTLFMRDPPHGCPECRAYDCHGGLSNFGGSGS